MSEVSKTEIGRRFFKLQQEKQVEKAVEKIRQAQGSEWSLYTHHDIEALKTVLAETWVYIDRDSWESISFTQLTGTELRELIRSGKEIREAVISGKDATEKTMPILMKKVS
jgi:hypothetical protein